MKTIPILFFNLLASTFLFCQNEECIKTGENTIYITTYGQGQPILIINGGPGMNSNGFRGLAEIIGKSNKAIIYDQRGTGKSKLPNIDANTITLDSMINDIEIIRNHLNIEQWVVLGHSFGGMLGSYYASKFPEKIKGLILSSSGGINMDLFSRINITSKLNRADKDSLNYWNAKIANGDTTYFASLQRGKYLAPAYLFNKSNVPIVAERLTQGNPVINSLVYQNMRKINFDCSDGLKKIKVPVLIIQGKQDIIDMDTATSTIETMPHSTLVILENCGHYGWLDQPEQYFKNINDFLKNLNT
ncbi:alpha/beta fold hydrolase [Flavobacteriaceae bacterium KMM 6897]|nr:alpha/beta fold hydrolase [Flavobacteriaceae bacterium KMM 6897]